MDEYVAWQYVIRISSDIYEATIQSYANEIAVVTASAFGVDGANVWYGHGHWKGTVEHGATIEIVTRIRATGEQILGLKNHICALGLSAFVTEATVRAFELYEE